MLPQNHCGKLQEPVISVKKNNRKTEGNRAINVKTIKQK